MHRLDNNNSLHEFSENFQKCLRIVKYCGHIWNEHGKCIKMSTNMPMFGPVVLKTIYDIFINKNIYQKLSTSTIVPHRFHRIANAPLTYMLKILSDPIITQPIYRSATLLQDFLFL